MKHILFNTILGFISGSVIFLCSANAATALTYHGRITKPDNTPLEGSSVDFHIQIRSPNAENCLLFDETQTLNMTGSGGLFVITIGQGTRVAPGVDGGYSIERIFSNRGTLTGLTCSVGNSYIKGSADSRKLVVEFNEGTGWQALPAQSINFMPLAIESMQVGGYPKDQLLRVSDGTTASEFSAANWTSIWDYVTGNGASPGNVLAWNGTRWVPGAPAGGTGTGTSSTTSSIFNSDSDNIGADGGFNFQRNATNLLTISNSGDIVSTSTTASTSSATGAVKVSGGLGVAGDIFAAASLNGTTLRGSTSLITPQIYGSTVAGGDLRVDGTSDATKGDVLLATAGGNVGIGTATPAYPLQVVGTAAASQFRQPIGGGINYYTNASSTYFNGNGLDYVSSSTTLAGPNNSAVFLANTSSTVNDFTGITFGANGTGQGYIGAVNRGSSNGDVVIGAQNGATAYSEGIRLTSDGKVGIGTTTPASKLEVSGGAISGTAFAVANANPLAVNFALGNTGIAATTTSGAVALSNMAVGGAYTLIVQDATSRTYDFTNGGAGSQCATATTRYVPANGATIASSHAVYTVLYAGAGLCYISWVTGF